MGFPSDPHDPTQPAIAYYSSLVPPPPPPPRPRRWSALVIALLLVLNIATSTAAYLLGKQSAAAVSASPVLPTATATSLPPDAVAALETSDYSRFIKAFAALMDNGDYAAIQRATDTLAFFSLDYAGDAALWSPGQWNEMYDNLTSGIYGFSVHYPPVTPDQAGYTCVGYNKTGITALSIPLDAQDVEYDVGTASMRQPPPDDPELAPDGTVFIFELPNGTGATWLWRGVVYKNQQACL